MIGVLLPISLLAMQATPVEPTEAVEEPVVTEAVYDEEVDLASLKRIYVANSDEATRVEIQHPLQDICVRKLLAGSRVKARTVCQDQTSWKAYVEAQEAMAKEWADTGRALRSDEMITGAPAGRAYGPGG